MSTGFIVFVVVSTVIVITLAVISGVMYEGNGGEKTFGAFRTGIWYGALIGIICSMFSYEWVFGPLLSQPIENKDVVEDTTCVTQTENNKDTILYEHGND